MKKNSARQAFPTDEKARGLTKLELFTMAAMQGIVAHSTNYLASDPEDVANDALEVAKAVLKKLEPYSE